MLANETTPCEHCGWENATVRRRCRNCGESLVLHPDPAVDREVRLDQADGLRADAAAGTAS